MYDCGQEKTTQTLFNYVNDMNGRTFVVMPINQNTSYMMLLVDKYFLFFLDFISIYGSETTVIMDEISIDVPERDFFTDHTFV